MTTYRHHDRSGLLAYVERYIAEHGYGPTLREVQAACGLSSTSVAAYNVHRLVDDGALCYAPGIARSLTLGRRAPLIEDLRMAVQALQQDKPVVALAGLVELLKRLEGLPTTPATPARRTMTGGGRIEGERARGEEGRRSSEQ
jgi:SOS-response transcriptional repressor LexA